MRDKEQLEYLLMEIVGMGRTEAAYTADHLLANGVTVAKNATVESKWIPVSERLPERRKDVVIIALRWGEVDVGWCEDGVWGSEFVDKYEDGEVTHWMPLPEPPKEGE